MKPSPYSPMPLIVLVVLLNTTSCLGSIEYGGRAVLQTALAFVRKAGRKVKARVLFYSGSHKTFVTRQVKEQLGLHPTRQEKLGIKTFGSLNVDERLREVVRLRLESTEGKKAGVIEAYVVENISEVQNENVEVIEQDFKHLKNIWFSDVCRSQEVLAVDIIVGIDFLHSLQDGKTIRGEPGQPVAIKTKLGWVISGPLKAKEHMKAAGLNLRKWKTSDPILAKEFEEEKIITASQNVSPTEETYAKETLGSEEGHDSTKVLGNRRRKEEGNKCFSSSTRLREAYWKYHRC
ncbi:uncharacterized protein LOC135689669 isoform X2 [Rhopilema esculentum]|uniref:uncharacterized protein LOC135689669 isoform X2 n=1 Tax=Rhopilema esculentum TaxID=499914 RepID=UPI0031E228C9